jgi:RNA polymerase sigma factor (sigma-70 family)
MEKTYYEYSIARVYEKYSQPVIRFLYCLIKDMQLSEDILHDTFVKILEKKIIISEDSKTTLSFLCKISKNRAIDQLKRIKSENEKYSVVAFREFDLNRHTRLDLEDIMIEGELISTLHDTIDTFSDEERTIFLENMLSDKTASRIGDEFNRSEYQVRKILKKINQDIKRNLKEFECNDIFFK